MLFNKRWLILTYLSTILTFISLIRIVKCQNASNLPPYFVAGSGDMARFSLSENSPVGSPVYQLKAVDPEDSRIHYSISGPIFSVDRNTGVVRLRQELDREQQNLIEVIISITDEGIFDTEPNTISLRRVIPIRDYNDNPPTFIGRPYTAEISESSAIGTQIDIRPPIVVIDRDDGINAQIKLTCFNTNNSTTSTSSNTSSKNNICNIFQIKSDQITNGNYTASLTLLQALDYETRSSYIMTIMAQDLANENSLISYATIAINVIDVQDQPPIFLNSPYSTTIEENTPPDTSILTITAIDGDNGNPRQLEFTLINETMNHFQLINQTINQNNHNNQVTLVTTNTPLDRESIEILQKGGVYTFYIRATEIINNNTQNDTNATTEITSTMTQITIVVIDIDDHIPEFNQPEFNISIPENLNNNMPIPGLTLFANDRDLNENSRYQLTIQNIQNSANLFDIQPKSAEGRTPIIIKILNSTQLDYDVQDVNLRIFQFYIIASVNQVQLAKTRIIINLLDSNDNLPIFNQSNFHIKIHENLPIQTQITNIQATDLDSQEYGEIEYQLKGFGHENFYMNASTGNLYIQKLLDYEKQNSYSLSIIAKDGGQLETNTNLLIEIIDINDNYPQFEYVEYLRIIREGAILFEPQFFIRATDLDGMTQGGNNLTYQILSENSISGHVFDIDQQTGEILLKRYAKSMDTEKGQYELVISATDHGKPPLQNTTNVIVRVGIMGNQRPIFKGHFRNNYDNLPVIGPPSYRVKIPENALPGDNVTIVSAQDPDGIDSLLRYQIIGSNDNFIINEKTGLIQVSSQAHLDRDTNPNNFQIIVNAIDSGLPIPETATTTVYVNIEDINDKPPKFQQHNYIIYISERTPINTTILQVYATDTDLNSNLKYTLKEISATTKTGVLSTLAITNTNYNLQHLFRINEATGDIIINNTLRHDLTAVITLQIQVEDLNAELNKLEQFDLTDVIIYVQSYQNINPIFINNNWSSNVNTSINIHVKEEMPINSTIYQLKAYDPLTNQTITNYQFIENDAKNYENIQNYFHLNEISGEIMLMKRLDYEQLMHSQFHLNIQALTERSNENLPVRSTIITLIINIENVNDNSPIFDQTEYHVKLIENTKFPYKVITVHATDKDAKLTNLDDLYGYHQIIYTLSGENSHLFHINNVTGDIIISPHQIIDRELTPKIQLLVKAEDSPGHQLESKSSVVQLNLEILDINDNSPQFQYANYTTVIPENVLINSFVLNVTANDLDDGPGGEIRYELLNENDVYGLFKINRLTGELRTKAELTGKGRSQPYEIIIRAQDNGGQIQKQVSLYTDVSVMIYIGDVSANDGIPYFVAPLIGQIANISENATIGSAVFQVIATDPDHSNTPSGTLFYKIQNDTLDAEFFHIDAISGLITTTSLLDREIKDLYNLILEVSDNGLPRQSTTRILRIKILDIDDHQPHFIRDIDSQPLEIELLEEQPIGTFVTMLTAYDEDLLHNNEIDYMFINGNHENLFDIKRTINNSAIITTKHKLDREKQQSYLLTVKCYQYINNTNNQNFINNIPRTTYNQYDNTHLQILIQIQDIDDNLPQFLHTNLILGIRNNVAIDTLITTLNAIDIDINALPIIYTIFNITFIPQYYKRQHQNHKLHKNLLNLFSLNNQTGELRTNNNFDNYIDGYFHLQILANNSLNSHKKYSNKNNINNIKIYIIRDKSLLKFIFMKPVHEIQNLFVKFQSEIQEKLHKFHLIINIYNLEVYINHDLNLDFSATTCCFQLYENNTALTLNQMSKLMNSMEMQEHLLDLYVKYSISNIETCAINKLNQQLLYGNIIYSVGTWLILLASLIGIGAIIATCTAFCLAKKFKKHNKQRSTQTTTSSRSVPEIFSSSSNSVPAIYYSEPIYGPL